MHIKFQKEQQNSLNPNSENTFVKQSKPFWIVKTTQEIKNVFSYCNLINDQENAHTNSV
jgi:hypothetical protein